MYLLLAAIVLVLLFAASFGGRDTWVALGSTTLSVLLVAGLVFIASANTAGPFLKTLAAQMPPSINGGVEDLAYAAERTAASLSAPHERVAEREAPPPAAAIPPQDGKTEPARSSADWLDVSWLDFDWLDFSGLSLAWLNPWNWFGDAPPAAPEVDLELGQDTKVPGAEPASPSEPEAPMPTVRALMPGHDDEARKQANAAPSYRIVTPPEPTAVPPADGLAEDAGGAPVKWLPDAPHPQGMERIVLTGTNVSNAPLEDIQATLKPDAANGNTPQALALNLRIEGQGDADGSPASIPPGTRFHLQAADLSEADAAQLGGAIVSFAYSQGGRRRTSILYLDQAALSGRTAGTQ